MFQKKEKVVLVNVKSDVRVHPLSLLYVGSALKRASFEIKIYNVAPGDIEEETKKILELNPLFVGFSVFTGLHTAVAARMSQKLKELNSSITIVWGGIHPSLVPEQCLQENFVDMVVIGEGEETAVELAFALRNGTSLDGIKGIAFKRNGKIFMNAPRPLIGDLDSCAIDWSLIDTGECIDEASDGVRFMAYMSSRGCPFNCGFCYNLAFNKGRRWRPSTIDHVITEILRLKEISGINGIVFSDDNFMVDQARAFKILTLLRGNGIGCVRLEMRLDLLNGKILNTLNDLGVKNIFIGWESGSNRILKLINKDITREEIISNFSIFKHFPDISVIAAGIIGFPTETWEETCETIDLGVKIAEMVPANIVTLQTFLPYPGTDLYPLAIKEGLRPPERSIDWAGYDTFSGKMKLEWLPWANKQTPRLFYRIDKYGKLLNHAPANSFLRTICKKILYFISRIRLKSRFFAFPVEIFILYRFSRYYLYLKGRHQRSF